MNNPVARITGNPSKGYHAELWSGHGSCLMASTHNHAQDALDAVQAILPGVEIFWHIHV